MGEKIEERTLLRSCPEPAQLRWAEENHSSQLERTPAILPPPPKTRGTHPDLTNTKRWQRQTGTFKYKNKKYYFPLSALKKKASPISNHPLPLPGFPLPSSPRPLAPSSLRDWLYLKNYISAQAFKNAECLKQSSRISMFLTASWQLCGPRPASN